MNVRTRPAREQDVAFLCQVDRHVSPQVLSSVVAAGRVLIAEATDAPLGLLRWGMLWDEVPFMNLLHVLPEHRGRGVGTTLVHAWEAEQAAAGHAMVLTCTSAAESAAAVSTARIHRQWQSASPD